MNNYKTTEFKNIPTGAEAFKQALPMLVTVLVLATGVMALMIRAIH